MKRAREECRKGGVGMQMMKFRREDAAGMAATRLSSTLSSDRRELVEVRLNEEIQFYS